MRVAANGRRCRPWSDRSPPLSPSFALRLRWRGFDFRRADKIVAGQGARAVGVEKKARITPTAFDIGMMILRFGDLRGAICERESGGEIAGFLASTKTPVFDRPARGQRREQIARLQVAQRGRAGAARIAGERIKIGHGESAPKAGRNRRGKSLGESFFAVFLQALALDAHCGDRAREQAVEPDRIVARFAKAEIAGLNAPQRAHDFAEQIAVAVALAQFDREFGFFAGAVVFVRDGVGDSRMWVTVKSMPS